MKESLEDYKTSITNSITLIVQEFLSHFYTDLKYIDYTYEQKERMREKIEEYHKLIIKEIQKSEDVCEIVHISGEFISTITNTINILLLKEKKMNFSLN